jgi:hypothetical protein
MTKGSDLLVAALENEGVATDWHGGKQKVR